MAEAKSVLVLHLLGGGDPVRIAITPEAAAELTGSLPKLLLAETPQTITAADGTPAVVNFAHVVAALVTPLAAGDWAYGS
ncbi:MAG TPA: hypothetical protein VLJ59_00955 [Mycobacteriales bacterium]|nr:hypothetical protein [Mycobacteriales bacterium]